MQTIKGHCPNCGDTIEFEVTVRGVEVEMYWGQTYAKADLHVPKEAHECPDPDRDRIVPDDDGRSRP